MPLGSIDSRNQLLDGLLGTTRGSTAEDSYTLELWDGQPDDAGSLEITGSGYSNVTVNSDDWPAAADGEKALLVTCSTPTGEWDEADYWALRKTGGDLGPWGALVEPLVVTGAGAAPTITLTVLYNENLEA
jgi:hypothetical protein